MSEPGGGARKSEPGSGARRERQYWGTLAPIVPASLAGEMARQFESLGLRGVFAPQVYGPPWATLAAAATTTTQLEIASGVALAFARSPFETAMAAMDLDRLSGGRFILGLGPSVKLWNEKRRPKGPASVRAALARSASPTRTHEARARGRSPERRVCVAGGGMLASQHAHSRRPKGASLRRSEGH